MSEYGPAMPPGWGEDAPSEGTDADVARRACIGPALPPAVHMGESASSESDDDGDNFGPAPPGFVDARHLAERKKKDDEGAVVREEWMTQLPEVLSGYGLQQRTTFRKHAGSEQDADGWTSIAGQKRARSRSPAKRKEERNAARDEAMQKKVDEHAQQTGRQMSLLEETSKSQSGKLDDDDLVGRRKPFNRDTELALKNLMSPEDRAAAIKNSQMLNSKFGHGGSKFL